MAINPYWKEPSPGGPMSVEDYLQLDKSTPDAKYEYLDGIARLMSGGSVRHDRIARNTLRFIEDQFLSGPCSIFGSDVRVLIDSKPGDCEQYVYPDATVSCDVADRRLDNTLIRSPRIVVEVLSPSTEYIDRGTKLAAYKAYPTIQEIVLINQRRPAVEIYRRDEEDDGVWHHVYYGSGSTVELVSVDVYLTMEEIYRGISFDTSLVEQ